jgi:hypothetical protein
MDLYDILKRKGMGKRKVVQRKQKEQIHNRVRKNNAAYSSRKLVSKKYATVGRERSREHVHRLHEKSLKVLAL